MAVSFGIFVLEPKIAENFGDGGDRILRASVFKFVCKFAVKNQRDTLYLWKWVWWLVKGGVLARYAKN